MDNARNVLFYRVSRAARRGHEHVRVHVEHGLLNLPERG
jgi:hypothetical protein